MKKWMIWCLAIMIALPSAAATPVYADDNTASTTNSNTSSNTSSNESSSNNSTVSSDTYSTDNSSTSTTNTSTTTSGGGGTVTTTATTNKPVINLIGDRNVRMKIGTPFADPGTTVQDDVYNDLSATVTYTLNDQPVNSINTNATGTYVIHYNVTTSDNRVADEATRTVTIVNVGDYVNLSGIHVDNAYGMAYHGDYVYVAQRDKGLARVNLYSGKVEQIVSSNQSFMAVALDSAGNLFFTIDSDSTIYKLDHNELNNLPMSESNFNAKKSVYFSSNQYTFFYGLAIDGNDNIYFTDYSSKSIIKLPTNSLTPQVVISGFSVKFTSFTFDPLGNLYTSGRDGNVYRIDSSSLQSLPLTTNSLVNISNGQFSGGYGMFFTPDGTSYMGSSFGKNQQSTLTPVITLNGVSPITITQYDTFYDPGVTVTPNKYTGLQKNTTYTLNGASVPGIDTSVAGTYTIHYNASITSQYVAKEVTRSVIVKPGPTQVSDVQLNRPFGLAYYNGDVYYADYSYGLSRISTKTFKITRIIKSYDTNIVAVALNKNGDLFYVISGQSKIYKLDHSYLSDPENFPYYDEDLEDYSKLYYQAPLDTSNNSFDMAIAGLAFDGNDRLYFTLQMDNELQAISKIMRFPADSATTPEVVATYPTRAYGLTISPLGNLYVNVGLNGLYKADASLLDNVPIAYTQFKLMSNVSMGYGVVFLPDRTGYTSSVQSTTNTLNKLSFLDSLAAKSVKLDKSTLTFTEGDAPALLTASILPDNATDTQLVWKSSNEQVATVQNGIVTPVGQGTASITVYVANQQDASDTATITVNAKPVIVDPVIVKDDKKKTDSSLTLGVDGGAGKTYVPSTASESRSTQFDGSVLRTITFDPNKMSGAINLLKSMKESTVRLNVPAIDNVTSNTDINLPLSVSNSISSNDMNLNINTSKIQLAIPTSSMLNVNQDINFKINVLDKYQDMLKEKVRASNMSIVKQIVGNADLSVVSNPIDIITNFQNKPVDVLIPLDTVKIPSLSVVKDLYVYVNHSDGSEEFIKPTLITDDSGNQVLQINTSKFSTFTVMQVSGTTTNAGTTPVTGTNPANTGGIVKPAYIEGYPDGTFRPNNSLTRAELASLLYRLQATSSNTGAVKSFKDVSSSFWANQAIQSMQSAGLMSGLPNGTFAPSKPITRAEMAIILSRWQGLSGQGGTTFATDINGHWAEREIKLVLTAGLMQGISPSSFQPNAPLTRAQAVTILNKILEKTAVLSARPTPWKDVPSSHWAYADIMEASNSYSLK